MGRTANVMRGLCCWSRLIYHNTKHPSCFPCIPTFCCHLFWSDYWSPYRSIGCYSVIWAGPITLASNSDWFVSRSIHTDRGRDPADRAKGSTNHSQQQQQHICENKTISMQDPVLSILNLIVSICHQNSTEYISVDLQVISRPGDCFLRCFLIQKVKMLRLFFTKKQRQCVLTEMALHNVHFLIAILLNTHGNTHTHTQS